MEQSIRWSVKVSKDTDIAVRSYLAQHNMRKGDLSKFIERAVQKEVFLCTVAEVHERNKDVPPKKIELAIDEALAEIRAEKWGKSRKLKK